MPTARATTAPRRRSPPAYDAKRLAQALKARGWEKRRHRVDGGPKTWRWLRWYPPGAPAIQYSAAAGVFRAQEAANDPAGEVDDVEL